MALSRKRRRALKRLRGQAENLLEQQKDVLAEAREVLKAASKQAKHLGEENISPRMQDAYRSMKPGIAKGLGAVRGGARRVRDVAAPAVATALSKTVDTLERLENERMSKQLQDFGEKRGLLKKKGGAGKKIALVLGIGAAVGVAFVAWQAFLENDELWVAPEEEIDDLNI